MADKGLRRITELTWSILSLGLDFLMALPVMWVTGWNYGTAFWRVFVATLCYSIIRGYYKGTDKFRKEHGWE